MKLRITTKGIENKDEMRDLAERRIDAALRRFADRIQTVTVLLQDVTGPNKQAVDKRCRIHVRLRSRGELMIDELGTEIQTTLALATDRLKAAMSRQVGRDKRGVGAG